MLDEDNNIIPICYRCDRKYIVFLINSIKSVLKYYKGDRKLIFYICTTESNLTLPDLDALLQKYNFSYHVVCFNDAFIQENDLNQYASIINRKYIGLWDLTHWLRSMNYNTTTFQCNPFNRSKFVLATSAFFIAVTKHKKLLLVDTDTVILTDITDLYETNVDNCIMAMCPDWAIEGTLSPSIAVVNTLKFTNMATAPNGLFDVMQSFLSDPSQFTRAFADVVQDTISHSAKESHVLLDKSWNVPVTHMHLYPEPKILHFSESWLGHAHVLNTYEEVVDRENLKDI